MTTDIGNPLKLAEAMRLANACASREGTEYRVFLACGFTPQHAKTFLLAYLAERMPNRRLALDVGLYGDLIGNVERIDRQAADAMAVLLEWEDLDPRLGLRSSQPWRRGDLEDVLANASRQLDRLLAGLKRAASCAPTSIVLPTLPLPPMFSPPLAWGDPISLTLQEKVIGFAAAATTIPSVRVLNPRRLDQISPPGRRSDLKSELRWGFPYHLDHVSQMCGLLARLLCPAAPMKGLITDLDGTLWSGILGEDGTDGISWDLDHSSHGHALYQRMLSSLAGIGVLLGVATKNDPNRVEQALLRNDLILPADCLFPVESHWGPKSESVARILHAWNVGAESVVFVDDNAMEIAEVAAVFPEIRGIQFPDSPDDVRGLLETLRDLFGKESVTDEDSYRLTSLRDSSRRTIEASRTGIEEVLSTANAQITLRYDQPDRRAFELINKTNQFNLNGRRIDESSWRERLADPRHVLLSVSYQDKYGPLGKIAVVSGMRNEPVPLIDVWVMSCRAFSRRIEHHVLKALFEHFDADVIEFDFGNTDRNEPLCEFINEILGQEAAAPVRIQRHEFLSRCPSLHAEVIVE